MRRERLSTESRRDAESHRLVGEELEELDADDGAAAEGGLLRRRGHLGLVCPSSARTGSCRLRGAAAARGGRAALRRGCESVDKPTAALGGDLARP